MAGTKSLRIAVLANQKYCVKVEAGAPPDALAEYDSEQTVHAIQCALSEVGHEAFYLEADASLWDTLRETRPDICFNIAEGLHGDARESHVPALLELLGIPYTGSKVLTHAISLDKEKTKRVWRDNGLPTAPFQVFQQADTDIDAGLTFPLFVKPMHEGSGMGINAQSIVHTEAALKAQVAWVIQTYRQPALVETYLPGREFTVGLVGNASHIIPNPDPDFYPHQGFHVFPVLEIDTQRGNVRGIYNAQAKSYAIDDAAAPGYLCPADISPPMESTLQRLALAAFAALDALDLARVDFRVGADGHPYLVEINTLPGLNPVLSDIVIAARAGGISHAALIQRVLEQALARYRI